MSSKPLHSAVMSRTARLLQSNSAATPPPQCPPSTASICMVTRAVCLSKRTQMLLAAGVTVRSMLKRCQGCYVVLKLRPKFSWLQRRAEYQSMFCTHYRHQKVTEVPSTNDDWNEEFINCLLIKFGRNENDCTR